MGQRTEGRIEVQGAFLDLLACDIEHSPERLEPLDPALRARVSDLVGDVEVDLDAPLDPADE